jgi:Uma2 family endonuclease
MSATRALISVEQYLRTSYRPDRDYVDGEVVERNVGEPDHSWLQGQIVGHFLSRYKGIFVFPELRVQVKPTRYRIPDICVFLEFPNERIPSKPPFLCIEILSPEDRMQRVQARINGYFEMGVPYVWILDPQTKRAYAATAADSLHEVEILRTDSPILELLLNEILA